MSVGYCGVAEHDDDCLCDVVIPHPTRWVDDAVQDMWMGQEIVNLKGYVSVWDDESILAYLMDLVFAKDGWSKHGYTANKLPGSPTPMDLRAEIRRRLQSMENPSIMTVIRDIGLCYSDLMTVLFFNKRYMSPSQLEEFEQDVVGRKFSGGSSLGKKYGMSDTSANRLHSYWGVPYASRDEAKPEYKKLVDELLITRKDLDCKAIADIVNDRFGLIEQVSAKKVLNRKDYLQRCKRI